jgi:hypothetical protein
MAIVGDFYMQRSAKDIWNSLHEGKEQHWKTSTRFQQSTYTKPRPDNSMEDVDEKGKGKQDEDV